MKLNTDYHEGYAYVLEKSFRCTSTFTQTSSALSQLFRIYVINIKKNVNQKIKKLFNENKKYKEPDNSHRMSNCI